MFYINDEYYNRAYIETCFSRFEKDPILNQCANKRFTVCIQDAALWIALCLYMKKNGGSVFPLPTDTPIDAARQRAIASKSHYLFYSATAENNKPIETLSTHANDEQAVLIQMSSGTSGEPKIIERSWLSIDEEIAAYIQHFSEANTMTPVIAAPISHSYGLICGVLVAFSRHINPTIITNLNPKYILRKLQALATPILYSSPTLINTITLFMQNDQKTHAIMTSGTLMQEQVFNRVKSKTKHLYQQYGCSEAGCISLGKDIDTYNNIGKPLPHHDVSTGNNESSSEEIIVKSNQKKNIATGDLAYTNENGELHFISRIDDMINIAGLNVYPAEVENIVLTFPDIEDAVVFKRQNSLGNEQICLHFIAKNTIDGKTLRQWCRNKLATHQIPMNIIQVNNIDKLANGKINRKKLAESI